ncbi:MAG TPA: DUF983 domain-containing protein [Sphingomicrobium sp.]|jgi:uncharacterized protein (DUF983 family)
MTVQPKRLQANRFVDDTGHAWPPLPPYETGLRSRCPRCGKGRLFDGFLKLREDCEVCGLDYSYADPADGPAIFVQLFACVPGVLFMILLEIIKSPPLWVHLFVSLPIVVLSTLGPLRPIKGWLVASQFFHEAREGQIVG